MRLPLLYVLVAAGSLLHAADAPQAAAPRDDVPPWLLTTAERKVLQEQTNADHEDMLRQLGITKLRPGRDGSPNASGPNAANYDQAKANPYPDYPDALVLKNGEKVTSPHAWWHQRRPEIVADFEREVVGRVPADVPALTWSVARTLDTTVAGVPVHARKIVGHADNSDAAGIKENITGALVLPANAKGPVPVLIMFSFGNMPDEPAPTFGAEPKDPPSTEQLIASGWGYVSLNTNSIQPDSGAGLTRGIIGLTNKGKRRTPEQWGALRAWAWGASRVLDYLEKDSAVDAHRVGIEGVSRYGKAALVTMAFDPRFAIALIGSSGEGGVKPHRRNFGEAVENLTSSYSYHWMAGNFIKYGAEESRFGRKDANDIPVESNELIALCAPRPVFVSYGIPEKGDANWLDQQGSYMATVAAGQVYRLLGAKAIGAGQDYHTAKMPPVNTGLLDGELAWRQHDGGHEDRSNMKYFIAWADRELKFPGPTTAQAVLARVPVHPHAASRHDVPADEPLARTDRNSQLAHEQLVAKARQGGVDVYFEGDSITRRWGATDYPQFLENWKHNFYGWNAGDFGWGGDRTQNIIWRLQHGELDGVEPKVYVLLAGTNNVGRHPAPGIANEVPRAIKKIIDLFRAKSPDATIILTAIFPRNDTAAANPVITEINAQLASLADGKKIRFVSINHELADASGTLHEGLTMDKLHPTAKGYQIWADALKPIFTEVLGPPAATDHAPAPTGDPSAKK